MKTFEKNLNKVQQIAEEKGWNVDIEDNGDTVDITFQKYSPAGKDFYFIASGYKTDGIYGILDSIYNYWEGFDVSYETYLWLDEFGHGKNGAPYDMLDVYNDMKECDEAIYELWNVLKETDFEEENE